MKNFIWVCFFLLGSASGFAQAPLPPTGESPYSTGVKDRTTKLELTPSAGHWAFDVTISNPNGKAITCRQTQFLAYLDSVGNSCQNPEYQTYLDLAPVEKILEIPSNGSTISKEVGYNERIAKNTITGKTLEYCGRQALALDCGYSCSNERKYGASWDEAITGGTKKMQCDVNGTIKRTLDPITCSNGYSADPLNDRCIINCDSQHRAGDSWSLDINKGAIIYTCLTSGQIADEVRCSDPALYIQSGKSCIPSPCGSTSHGSRGNNENIPNGTATYQCDFGRWINRTLSCSAGYQNKNDSCVELPCDGIPHGGQKFDIKTCNTGDGWRGSGTKTTYQCDKGSWKFISTVGAGCTFGGGGHSRGVPPL